MDKQIIISISREYGSGGHEIAKKLSQKLSLPFYDRNLLDEIAKSAGADVSELSRYDADAKHFIFSRNVRGYSNNPIDSVAELQFALLKSKAADSDSFVVVGRCSDEIFEGIAPVIRIFISADTEAKIQRVIEKRGLDRKLAEKALIRHDKNRMAYHDHFCKHRWADSRTYDLCVNATRLGIDGTVEMLYDYIQRYIEKNAN